jgi:hypothetical protein
MKDFVFSRWIRVIAQVSWISVVWVIFSPYGLPLMSRVAVAVSMLGLLALSAALFVDLRLAPSMDQVIDGVEGESSRLVYPRGSPWRCPGHLAN